MIAFICLFFPAVLSVCMYERLTKRELGFKRIVYRFCINALIINFICFLSKKLFFGTAEAPLYTFETDMRPTVAINYIITAVAVAVALTLFEVLLSKKVRIYVEEDKEKEKDNTDEEKTQD